MFSRVPIPLAGLMLGLAALGNLWAPYSLSIRYACGLAAALAGLLLVLRILLHPATISRDLKTNSVFASVSATFFMAVMQLCTYTAPSFPAASERIWLAAIIGHFLLMIGFTWQYMLHFSLKDVFPTYFIAYVGIVVASVTSPVFHHELLGEGIFWFGFIAYACMFALVTIRYYCRRDIAESAKPLFCIYTAPMSLSLTGYLACVQDKMPLLALFMVICAQLLFLLVLYKMPKLLRLPFYPSYAAFTFPFVITAIALRQTVQYLMSLGWTIPAVLYPIIYLEIACATAIVLYVAVRYAIYLIPTLFSQTPAYRMVWQTLHR
ncbi:TDT family transporter [uncultured Megasphaera sp.]|uniref:TDT family transporter n=1 Tax=uncultured Megasphaera sp. TaxID=165188 RepID=UPI0026599D5A|nr:TDT family transporter [uncultured Megasphaera sp.]